MSEGEFILVEGARQNNLKGLDLKLPLNRFIVVTGVSGSGKSSLAFDTLYAEGQRRYVETFSPYARQFLDRMDKPRVDRIVGIPPAVAIDQTNPVRTSRSTVGTMTELCDHIKLLYARAATLHCRGCGKPVRRDNADTIWPTLTQQAGKQEVLVTFPCPVPKSFKAEEARDVLAKQGFQRALIAGEVVRLDEDPRAIKTGTTLDVIADRVRIEPPSRARVVEALEIALKYGKGRVQVRTLNSQLSTLNFSADLHCPDCDIHYRDPSPNLFSFNSPLGACDKCRGFGRTIEIDYDRVVPNPALTLAGGAIKIWQSESYRECQDDMMEFAPRAGCPTDAPWEKLPEKWKRWVIDGEGRWEDRKWYGLKRFFAWLETKTYKMHVRVLLSRYRAYVPCPDCGGARLKSDALCWRIGRDVALSECGRGLSAPTVSEASVAANVGALRPLPHSGGLAIHELYALPISRTLAFFESLRFPGALDKATELLLGEIRTRLRYLNDAGLGYLTLDRQSRTLSGGEVQRVNLTTALGTSLVNTLFVLDEPSIGLHPRDIGRLTGVLHGLRDKGNTLLVVEHDPDLIRAADRVLDLGPGPGEHGGQLVFEGKFGDLCKSARSLTGQYFSGKKRVALSRQRWLVVKDAGSARVSRATVGVPPTVRSGAASTRKSCARGVSGETPDTGTRDACVPRPQTDWLRVCGASEHNLKNIDVGFPLNRLTVLTGVSGSGKSTLLHDVLYRALCKLKRHPDETAGAHRAIEGYEQVGDVVLVDQAPIGRTPRANPATYTGAFDEIRKLFAATPDAIAQGFTASTFSFNSEVGRCPVCEGTGFEHVEMQFLSDVFLRCPECDGKRYRPPILAIRYNGRNIPGVLDLTVNEAVEFFGLAQRREGAKKELGGVAASRETLRRQLEPLREVGLGYVKLGQPITTLSGGESQRLKLAGHLAEAKAEKTSFLFDEPTTGLHLDDIQTLLSAFERLLERGHSLIVIEHHLDVIRNADWVIDLGPEGGDEGGRVVVEGTPEQVMACKASHTGMALRGACSGGLRPPAVRVENRRPQTAATGNGSIEIVRAREHNLRDLSVSIPRDRFTVITGVSGSGKSTLAFDLLFNEGQRRYLETLNAYARQFIEPAARPDVDLVTGVPPTVAIEQRTSRGGRKSTVATVTETYHFLRLLFAKLGTQFCPDCNVAIEPQTVDAVVAAIAKGWRGRQIELLAPRVRARKGFYLDLAEWAARKGIVQLRVDGGCLPSADFPRLDRFKEHDIDLVIARPVVSGANRRLTQLVEQALEFGNGTLLVAALRRKDVIFSTRRACPKCSRSFEELDPRLFSFNSRHGWCPTCCGFGRMWEGPQRPDSDMDGEGRGAEAPPTFENEEPCPTCNGARLNPVARAVRLRGNDIACLTAMPASEFHRYLDGFRLGGRVREIARDIIAEMRSRLEFLELVGLGYLSLDRSATTLSGGEAQRIRLAAQLGSNLRGVCYILDEPTIGLHPRDNAMLLGTLRKLREKGNTVVVVEHDETTIRSADHLIDLGPGAGIHGGKLVAAGTPKEVVRAPASVTGKFLREPMKHPTRPRRGEGEKFVEVHGATLHNLKKLAVKFPLGRFTAVTGVSGSGKSTLVRDVLLHGAKKFVVARFTARSGGYANADKRAVNRATTNQVILPPDIRRVLEVDQTPIGKTPRSCPATYVGFYDDIRRLFAQVPEAKMRGYGPERFSFNVPTQRGGGHCETCEGQGIKRIAMSFLPDVRVPCDECRGRRFTPETRDIRFKGKSIADVLAMSVEEALEYFKAEPFLTRPLSLLHDVGLDYLTLGQQSPTLSGGEAQRIKLVTELAKPTQGRTLYILDEPTVGLHMADVARLIEVLHRLVDAGNTLVVIEHNLDIIAEADHIIDLGPEGGDAGGRVVALGAPEEIIRDGAKSHTARMLKEFLKTHS